MAYLSTELFQPPRLELRHIIIIRYYLTFFVMDRLNMPLLLILSTFIASYTRSHDPTTNDITLLPVVPIIYSVK